MSSKRENSFLPKDIIRTRHQDGSITTSEVYSYDTWVNRRLLKWVLILFAIGVSIPFLSCWLLLNYCFGDGDENFVGVLYVTNVYNITDVARKAINIFSIFLSLYILIDSYNNWILSLLIAIFYKGNLLRYFVIYLNGAMIIINSILLFFSDYLFKLKKSKLELFIYIVGISAVSYFITVLCLQNLEFSSITHTNNTPQTLSSTQTSSPDPQQTNQNYTSQAVSADTSRMVITQPTPTIQVDTTRMVSVDTTKQIQAPNQIVDSSTNNNANTTIVDDNKKNIIEKYLKGQDNRNFEEFAQYYAPNIRRNWEMYNPTLSKIQGAIYHLWSVTSSSSQTINNVDIVNDSTIKADVTNVYITRKKNLTKQIEYDIYFVFDNNNQIVETYGFEK